MTNDTENFETAADATVQLKCSVDTDNDAPIKVSGVSKDGAIASGFRLTLTQAEALQSALDEFLDEVEQRPSVRFREKNVDVRGYE